MMRGELQTFHNFKKTGWFSRLAKQAGFQDMQNRVVFKTCKTGWFSRHAKQGGF